MEHLYRSDAGVLRQALGSEPAFHRLRALVDVIDSELQGTPIPYWRYCMFLLRAFYYEELAGELSLSSVPHTYRAEAMLALPPGIPGSPQAEAETEVHLRSPA